MMYAMPSYYASLGGNDCGCVKFNAMGFMEIDLASAVILVWVVF
jgi:hypothetical protein